MNPVSLDESDHGQLPPLVVAGAVAVTAATLGLGYWAFGLLTMFIVTAGFVGGLLLWLMWPTGGGWADVRVPYWVALALFVAHRVEEKQMAFFDFLATVTWSEDSIGGLSAGRVAGRGFGRCLAPGANIDGPWPADGPIPGMDLSLRWDSRSWRTSWCFRGSIPPGSATCRECGALSHWLRSRGGACGASPGRPLVLAPGETTYGVATYIVVGDASPSAFRFSAAVRDGVPWNRRCPLRYLCCTSDHYT